MHFGTEPFARRSSAETVSLPTIRAEVDSARDRYRVSPNGTSGTRLHGSPLRVMGWSAVIGLPDLLLDPMPLAQAISVKLCASGEPVISNHAT